MQENLVNLIPSNKLHNFFWCSYKVNEFDLENFLQSMGVRSLLSACTYSYTYVNVYLFLFHCLISRITQVFAYIVADNFQIDISMECFTLNIIM